MGSFGRQYAPKTPPKSKPKRAADVSYQTDQSVADVGGLPQGPQEPPNRPLMRLRNCLQEAREKPPREIPTDIQEASYPQPRHGGGMG